MTESGPFRILVVCTANICRSPMAENLLRRTAKERGFSVEVSSAGFLFDDERASTRAVAVLNERDLDASEHRTRIVTPEILAEADVVVTMERHHARELIVEHSYLAERVHTLGGLADALADLDPSPGSSPIERVAAAIAGRPAGALLGTGPDEVADPHGRSKRRHRLTADRISVLVDALLEGLFGSATDEAEPEPET